MNRTKKLPNITNLPHKRTVLPPRITGKKITRPDTSIPNKRWNMRVKPCSGRKMLIGSLRRQRGNHKGARTTAPRLSERAIRSSVHFNGRENWCLFVQHHTQERGIDLKTAVVLNETQLPEFVHEKIDA